ncbi:MAG: hypothetical protein ABIQ44_05320 [Chloroflexia bacterium]
MLPKAEEKNNATNAPDQQGGDEAQRIAQAIHGAGMGSVARVALETLKPMHWIAGQFAWALQPFLGAFRPFSKRGATPIDSMARLLEREGGVGELTMHLDMLLEDKEAAKASEEKQR